MDKVGCGAKITTVQERIGFLRHAPGDGSWYGPGVMEGTTLVNGGIPRHEHYRIMPIQ